MTITYFVDYLSRAVPLLQSWTTSSYVLCLRKIHVQVLQLTLTAWVKQHQNSLDITFLYIYIQHTYLCNILEIPDTLSMIAYMKETDVFNKRWKKYTVIVFILLACKQPSSSTRKKIPIASLQIEWLLFRFAWFFFH